MKSNIKLVEMLKENNLTITCCESLTGGLVASRIVEVAGSSKVLNESYVTYAISSKISLVGVDKEIIDKYGVVSEETAYEMAKKSSLKAKSDIAISTTGIAGPTGGDEKNPVGTVCFGFKIGDEIITLRKVFENKGRNKIRNMAANFAISYMCKLLNKKIKKVL